MKKEKELKPVEELKTTYNSVPGLEFVTDKTGVVILKHSLFGKFYAVQDLELVELRERAFK